MVPGDTETPELLNTLRFRVHANFRVGCLETVLYEEKMYRLSLEDIWDPIVNNIVSRTVLF